MEQNSGFGLVFMGHGDPLPSLDSPESLHSTGRAWRRQTFDSRWLSPPTERVCETHRRSEHSGRSRRDHSAFVASSSYWFVSFALLGRYVDLGHIPEQSCHLSS